VSNPKNVVRELLSYATVVAVMLMARSSLADHYHVPSGSMRPTVEVGDHVVVNKAAYGVRLPWTDVWLTRAASPARGDVIVLTSPEDGRVLLKRVVAVAGDRVEVGHGVVMIDGHVVHEPHRRLTQGGGPDLASTLVPPRSLLVVGDNRGNSHDGRTFGFVSVKVVLGRAAAVILRDGAINWIPFR
jgi:signal peptidase I